MKKKIIILSVFLLFTWFNCYAEDNSTQYLSQAQSLQKLGLFQGTANGFELERVPKKVEAGVMLIRLLGKEEEVKSGNYTHPFQDVPKWADSYIGYMYENGLTKGINAKEFGSDLNVDVKTYVTFVLRALGYNDTKGDFSWLTSTDTAKEKNILTQEELSNLTNRKFLRDDMVHISYNVLGTSTKEGSQTLADKLIIENVIDKEVCDELGLTNESSEKKYFVTYEVVKKNAGLYYTVSRDDVPVEYRDNYSNVSGFSGNNIYPTFTEEQTYIMLEPKYNSTFKFEGGETKIWDSGYKVNSYYNKGGNIIGYVDFSYITKEGTYTREFHLWDKEKEKKYYDKYNNYIDSMMANAKPLSNDIAKYFLYNNYVRVYYDLENTFGKNLGKVYAIAGTSEGDIFSAYDHTINTLKRIYVFGKGEDIERRTYNDIPGTNLIVSDLSQNYRVCFINENGVLGYLELDEKPKFDSNSIYEIEIKRTTTIEEDKLISNDFRNLNIDVLIDNKLSFKIKGFTLYDAQGAMISNHFSSEFEENEKEDIIEYIYKVGVFHFRDGNIKFRLSGPEAQYYNISW